MAVAMIKAGWRITIPKKMVESGRFEAGSIVSILPIGGSLIITPKRLELDKARRQMKKLLKISSTTMKELLKGTEKERESLFKEIYGASESEHHL